MNKNLIASIFGRKGAGKTELTRKIVRHLPRVLAYDTVAQYGAPDFTVIYGRAACATALARLKPTDEFKLSLRCDDTADLLDLMGIAYEITDSMVLIDEAAFYCSPSQLPPEISRLVRYGRHRRISQLYVAQRPSEIHRSITAQSDIIVSFVQREPRDVDYLVKAGGGEDAERVGELPKYKLIAFGDGMEGDDVPLPILAQLHDFGRPTNQLDMFERET